MLKSLNTYHWPVVVSCSPNFILWYSPLTWTRATRFFCVPLMIWHTTADNSYNFFAFGSLGGSAFVSSSSMESFSFFSSAFSISVSSSGFLTTLASMSAADAAESPEWTSSTSSSPLSSISMVNCRGNHGLERLEALAAVAEADGVPLVVDAWGDLRSTCAK